MIFVSYLQENDQTNKTKAEIIHKMKHKITTSFIYELL